MEELVSTEILEKEILEDARKKAERLLKGAAEDARRIEGATEGRKAEAAAEIERRSRAKAARHREELDARLPLEKARIKAAYVDSALREAVAAFVAALPEGRAEAMVAELLRGSAPFLDGKELRVRRRALGEAAAARAIAAALPAARVLDSVEDASLPAAGIVAEAADGSATMRATLDLAAESLLGQRRGELARALCGEALAL